MALTSPQPTDSEPKTLVDKAYADIKRCILDNEFPTGFSAMEPELALSLGISRTPLREALVRLQGEGLVEVIPRRGMRVLPVSAEQMAQIYQVVTALESLALELIAARKPSDADLQPLIDATGRMEQSLQANDLRAWALADEDFHRGMVELASNQVLLQEIMRHWDRTHRARMVTLHLRPAPVNSTREHMEMVDALRKGDVDLAVSTNRKHRARGNSELTRILSSLPGRAF
jgi:DNA-binding GntR family transcriptional regulator